MEIKKALLSAFLWYKIKIKKGDSMHSKNWFELIKAMIMAGLGYLAGIFL